MTEEQKRFKITKKESYENQISQENKKLINRTFLVGLSSAATLLGFLAATRDVGLSMRAACTAMGISNAGLAACGLKGVMEAISRKTMLEGKIEDINTELEMPENLENRGMKR